MHTESRRQRLLIVEDANADRQLISDRLTTWGYEALTASNGEEGFRMAKKHKPDLILLDFLMPGMTGPEMHLLLQEDPGTKDIPVIFLTGLEVTDQTRASLKVSPEDVILKSVEEGALRERIATRLKQAPSR